MKTILQNIQNQLKEIEAIKYLDEDWGQLDYYSPHMPVKFPCVLIDTTHAQYSNIGRDLSASPQNRQQAQATLSLTIADLRMGNTSSQAPQNQKETTWKIWDLIQEIHAKLQGFTPGPTSAALLRTALQRNRRDDGLQAYKLSYSFAIGNV